MDISPVALRLLPSTNLRHLLGLSLLSVTEHSLLLGLSSLDLALTGSLGLGTLGVHLLLDESLTGGLSLSLVDLYIALVFVLL